MGSEDPKTDISNNYIKITIIVVRPRNVQGAIMYAREYKGHTTGSVMSDDERHQKTQKLHHCCCHLKVRFPDAAPKRWLMNKT